MGAGALLRGETDLMPVREWEVRGGVEGGEGGVPGCWWARKSQINMASPQLTTLLPSGEKLSWETGSE